MRDQDGALSQRGSFRETVPPHHDPGSGAHPTRETAMRFYHQSHRFYCGVDLHARTMSLDILDQGSPAERVRFWGVDGELSPPRRERRACRRGADPVKLFGPALALEPEMNHRGAEETLLSIASARHARRKRKSSEF